jgi:4-hydroxy-tetrahydrodipicolinate reductase
MERLKVILCGAAGKMGREIVKSVAASTDLELAGAVDLIKTGEDAGVLAGVEPLGIAVTSDLEALLAGEEAAVLVDFTSPLTVMSNIRCALAQGVSPVVGTTGFTDTELKTVQGWVHRYNTGAIIAPNFALGAVLMMKMAQLCARYMSSVEIVEMHHDEKLDAPSGTAHKTAQLIREAVTDMPSVREELEKTPGVRGGRVAGIPVHSIRLPGMIAHQSVIYGAEGQVLTLSHDAIDRNCFIPGLLMAIRHAPANKQLIYGIEQLIEL